jgi:hypothetical protein
VQSGRQVVFGNGATTGFSCESQPDVTAVTVPAESTIQVVNATGRGAELLLDGRAQGAIGENGSTEVVFRRGTVAMALQPDCIFGDESTPVLVTASPTASPSPTGSAQGPTPSASSSPTANPVPSSVRPTVPSATVSVGGPSRRPPAPPAAERPTPPTRRPPAAGPSRSVRRPAPTGDAVPTGSTARRTDPPTRRAAPVDRATTTPPAVASATTGVPPGDDARPLPDVPTTEVPSPTATAPSVAVAAAAEPVVELEPLTRGGGIGLLALMAAVCVTGVMAGAIRTIAAQRATPSNLA